MLLVSLTTVNCTQAVDIKNAIAFMIEKGKIKSFGSYEMLRSTSSSFYNQIREKATIQVQLF